MHKVPSRRIPPDPEIIYWYCFSAQNATWVASGLHAEMVYQRKPGVSGPKVVRSLRTMTGCSAGCLPESFFQKR